MTTVAPGFGEEISRWKAVTTWVSSPRCPGDLDSLRCETGTPRHSSVWAGRGGRLLDQCWTLRFSAEVLPRFDTSSYSTTWPSLSVVRPALSTAEIWTKTSLPPPPCG